MILHSTSRPSLVIVHRAITLPSTPASIASVETIPYAHPFTHDILPASETHTYYAAGAHVGTTIAP